MVSSVEEEEPKTATRTRTQNVSSLILFPLIVPQSISPNRIFFHPSSCVSPPFAFFVLLAGSDSDVLLLGQLLVAPRTSRRLFFVSSSFQIPRSRNIRHSATDNGLQLALIKRQATILPVISLLIDNRPAQFHIDLIL